MPIKTANDLLADNKTSVEQFLNALTWLTTDAARLKERRQWIRQNALPELVESIDTQISAEIKEVEELVDSIKSRIKDKCTG